MVYRTDDWTEHARAEDVSAGIFPQVVWVPGEHVVALTAFT